MNDTCIKKTVASSKEMKTATMKIASDIYNLFHILVDHNGCMLFSPPPKTSFIDQLCKCSDSDLGQPVT